MDRKEFPPDVLVHSSPSQRRRDAHHYFAFGSSSSSCVVLCVLMELLAKRIDMYFYFFFILESVGRDANNLAESRPRAPALRCSRTPPKMRGKNKQFSLVVNMRKMLGTWKEKEQQCVSEWEQLNLLLRHKDKSEGKEIEWWCSQCILRSLQLIRPFSRTFFTTTASCSTLFFLSEIRSRPKSNRRAGCGLGAWPATRIDMQIERLLISRRGKAMRAANKYAVDCWLLIASSHCACVSLSFDDTRSNRQKGRSGREFLQFHATAYGE